MAETIGILPEAHEAPKSPLLAAALRAPEGVLKGAWTGGLVGTALVGLSYLAEWALNLTSAPFTGLLLSHGGMPALLGVHACGHALYDGVLESVDGFRRAADHNARLELARAEKSESARDLELAVASLGAGPEIGLRGTLPEAERAAALPDVPHETPSHVQAILASRKPGAQTDSWRQRFAATPDQIGGRYLVQ